MKFIFGLFSNIVIGGTGGDAFRSMYAAFLRECSTLLDNKQFEEAARRYKIAGECWREVGQLALPNSCTCLKQIKDIMYEKNEIFEEGKPDSISKLWKLQQKQSKILEEAALEAKKNQIDIIHDLCNKVKRCKALEQDALFYLCSCLEQ